MILLNEQSKSAVSKLLLNQNARKFKNNIQHEINVQLNINQQSGSVNYKAGARYECIYKNLLREIR